ncbi:hypothetical protein GCM10010176_021600 [Nonomuraea spiralis]|nr:hypothetical protein GCM10010176_021600 [Nonomuraea spiralis]
MSKLSVTDSEHFATEAQAGQEPHVAVRRVRRVRRVRAGLKCLETGKRLSGETKILWEAAAHAESAAPCQESEAPVPLGVIGRIVGSYDTSSIIHSSLQGRR